MVEILNKFFRKLKFESPRNLIQPNQENDSMFQTMWLKRDLIAQTYSRTVNNKKSMTKCLRKAYISLKNMVIPFSLCKMSPRQLKQHIPKVTSLYIDDNKQLIELFFKYR